MNRWAAIIGAFALLVSLTALSLVAILKVEVAPVVEKKKGPIRAQSFGEGIRLSQKGLIGIDLVSIGRVHMRKLRKGPFTIGAINELVLEDVELALPEALWNAGADYGSRRNKDRPSDSDAIGTIAHAEERRSRPSEMLAKLGINPGHIRMGEKIPRFSALAIRGLKVSRIVGGTNAVPWFAASRGDAKREGLALTSGWSVEGGVTNAWKEAFLAVDPCLRLYHQ